MENSEIECCVVQVVADAERSGGVVFPADLDYAFRCPEGRLDVGCSGCGSFKEGGRKEREEGRDTVIDPPPSFRFWRQIGLRKEERRPSVRTVSFTSYLLLRLTFYST